MITVQDRRKAVLNAFCRNELIEDHLYLVKSVSNKYRKYKFVEYDDLVQEGTIGLIKAIDSYDSTKGCPLKLWALKLIKYSIQDFLRKNSTIVHVPHNKLCGAFSLYKKLHDLEKSLGREIDFSDLNGIDIDDFIEYTKIIEIIKTKHLDIEKFNVFSKVDIFNEMDISLLKSKAHDILNEQEYQLFGDFFICGWSLRKISSKIGMSHEGVRKRISKILTRLEKE